MLTYFLKSRKNTKNKVCCLSKWQAEELLSNLGIKTPLSKIPLLNILF